MYKLLSNLESGAELIVNILELVLANELVVKSMLPHNLNDGQATIGSQIQSNIREESQNLLVVHGLVGLRTLFERIFFEEA